MSAEPAAAAADPTVPATTASEAAVPATEAALPAADAATIAATTPATAAAVTTTTVPTAGVAPKGGAALTLRRLLGLVVTVGLLGAGVAFGWNTHLANRPVPAVIGDPTVVGQPAPAIVQELTNAITSGDPDAIRAALPQEIFARYTAEMERFGIATVSAVETLGTYTEGSGTATALILHGTTTDRNPFSLNLVVVTQDGLIVRLR